MATTEGGVWISALADDPASHPRCLLTSRSRFTDAAFSDRAKWAAVSNQDALRVWNLTQQPPGPGSPLAEGSFRCLRFSTDERFLAAVTEGSLQTREKVYVWDLAKGTVLTVWQPHRDHVTDLAFSPDGTVLATTSWDNTCRLLDLRRLPGRHVTVLRGQRFGLWSVCFSADDRRLATGTGDGSIIIWDLDTGREVLVLRRPQGRTSTVRAMRFLPGGDSLVSVQETTVHLWRTPSLTAIEAAEQRGQEQAH